MQGNSRLAVLVPVFNAGDNLLRSINSCAGAGLGPDDYEILVVDNCSTDGATDGLPSFDRMGAPIHLFRNDSNIGRVGNWNRSVDIALEMGFRYITFLFAGDRWLPDSCLPGLLHLMRGYKAAVAFTPFVISRENGLAKRESQRFYVEGSNIVCSSESFLETLLESGLFPLGPLQANIYCIRPDHRPWFDTTEPSRTDVEATLDFVHKSRGPVLIGSKPFFEWREYAGRFHMSMGTGRTIEDYMETFQTACKRVGLPINYGRAKARVVLNSLRLMITDAPVRQWPWLLSVIAGCALRTPYHVSVFHFFGTLWSRYGRGRRLLQFG
jgi:glycosyltransferase involved in cell wall biosynthesis